MYPSSRSGHHSAGAGLLPSVISVTLQRSHTAQLLPEPAALGRGEVPVAEAPPFQSELPSLWLPSWLAGSQPLPEGCRDTLYQC